MGGSRGTTDIRAIVDATRSARLAPDMPAELTPRSESILKSLIEAYLLEGEPVGSRLLSRRYVETLSPATIRNVMADLEDEGLLDQPHTSAGRIPTERAYRYYVDRWVLPTQPDPQVGPGLQETLELDGRDMDAWLKQASRVLSEVFQGICVALPLPRTFSPLVRLEFVPLGPSRLVAIWVGKGGEVEHQVMDNPWRLPDTMLVELGNFATAHFAGCTLSDLRRRLLDLLRDHASQVREISQHLSHLAGQLCEPPAADHVVVSGLPTLLRLPEFDDGGRLRALVETFEEHEKLARLLEAFADAATSDVQLLLGSENPFLPAMPLATAVSTISLGGSDRAAFAVIQPMRVNYARFLGGLAWWSSAVTRRMG